MYSLIEQRLSIHAHRAVIRLYYLLFIPLDCLIMRAMCLLCIRLTVICQENLEELAILRMVERLAVGGHWTFYPLNVCISVFHSGYCYLYAFNKL